MADVNNTASPLVPLDTPILTAGSMDDIPAGQDRGLPTMPWIAFWNALGNFLRALIGLPAHSVLIGQGVAPITGASPGAAGHVLTSNGAAADPTFQAGLATPVTVPNGGSGDTTLTAHGVLIGQGVLPVAVTGVGGVNQFLAGVVGADPIFRNLASNDGPGIHNTIVLAKITPGGTNGSLTVDGGFIMGYVPPT